MRCPQCGSMTLAATQTHGVASAYCEDCAQWWEWAPRSRHSARSPRQDRGAGRLIARVAAGRPPDGHETVKQGAKGSRPFPWQGRLLRETDALDCEPASAET